MACPTTTLSEASTSTKLRVLVVDDSEFYIEAVSRLLATFPCVGTVDQALSGSEALARVAGNLADLMLVDIAMSDMNGLGLTQTIKAMQNSPKVIIVTLYDTPTYEAAARTAGADGFIGKSHLGEDLRGMIVQLFPQICKGFP